MKLHKSPVLIGNTVRDAVSDLKQFLATESPWKLMKNALYFVLKIFKLLPWLFGHVEKNSLIREKRLISKFMTSQSGSQTVTVAIHILPNISWSKGKQWNLKFGQEMRQGNSWRTL